MAATPGKKAAESAKSTQGGVAILARDWLGLNYLGTGSKDEKTAIVYPGRVAGAKVIMPGGRPIAVYSVYMRVGKKLSLANREILAKFAGHIQSHDLEWLVGGDFNMHPRELEAANFTSKLGGTIKAPATATCMMGATSTIDFFLVSNGLGSEPTQETSTRCEAIRPHLVVAMFFTVPLSQVKVLKYRWAPVLPNEKPFGPQLPPEDWTKFRAETRSKLEALREKGATQQAEAPGGAGRKGNAGISSAGASVGAKDCASPAAWPQKRS